MGAGRLVFVAAVVAAALAPVPSAGASYRLPPAPLVEIVDARPTPEGRASPDGKWLMLVETPSLLGIEDVSAPELRVGGLRISPRTNGPSRLRHASKLSLLNLSDLSERGVTGLPTGARMAGPTWSPDSRRVAFVVTRDAGVELWVADVGSAVARRVGALLLNAVHLRATARGWSGVPFQWLADGRTLVCSTIPAGRGPLPLAPSVPEGPVVQENRGKVSPAPTYQDLLANPHDEGLFDHFLQAQLARVDLGGELVPLGEPGILWDFASSPDGRWLRAEWLHRPYSYLVRADRFPRRVEILDREGRLARQIADLPLQEEVPITFGSVPTGPRSFTWRDDRPATLTWVEARDGGDAAAKADVRDELVALDAPFEGAPRSLATFALRYQGARWGTDELALVSERWEKTRRTRTWILRPGRVQAPELLFDRSYEDRYGDPGDPVMRPTASGGSVLLTADSGRTLFLIGDGASSEGGRPFLDRLSLETKKTERLFRSEAPSYERPVLFLDDASRRLLTRRESPEEPPNFFVRDLGKKGAEPRRLTSFPHPTPQLSGLKKELIRYDRKDGVKLSATLYLPPGHRPEDGPLPVLVWIYPEEFKSADAAGQVKDSPYRFDRMSGSSPLVFLTQGYAVLFDPTMPIVGEGETAPNDTYVEQLVASAAAAIEEVVRRGVADRNRIAISGASYGAFTAANLLAHSDLFRAGIARSGAYNRTLTPFGFQGEDRTLWEAPEVYLEMSPFLQAGKIDEPLLLIHGEADPNQGTFPMQSERLFNALRGLGGTARLVLLPHEGHLFLARESVLHMLWEMASWLDEHVKHAPPRN